MGVEVVLGIVLLTLAVLILLGADETTAVTVVPEVVLCGLVAVVLVVLVAV